jgi:hypothetical protein
MVENFKVVYGDTADDLIQKLNEKRYSNYVLVTVNTHTKFKPGANQRTMYKNIYYEAFIQRR